MKSLYEERASKNKIVTYSSYLLFNLLTIFYDDISINTIEMVKEFNFFQHSPNLLCLSFDSHTLTIF
jgi:hypothetical protein